MGPPEETLDLLEQDALDSYPAHSQISAAFNRAKRFTTSISNIFSRTSDPETGDAVLAIRMME